MTKQDFVDLEAKYYLPQESIQNLYQGLLIGTLQAYVKIYTMDQMFMNPGFDEETSDIIMDASKYDNAVNSCLDSVAFNSAFDAIAVPLTELNMKKEILTKVGDLTAYLSNSFANAFNVDQNAIIGAFKLNFSEEELSRVVTAMFTKKKSTLATNLSALGYQDLNDPTKMSFYFWSFDGKSHFMEFLNNYNEKMRSLGMEDKVIDYTDTTGVLMSSVKTIVDAVSYVLIAFVSISLVVSSIMIGVITYISVYERKKEIGILRAIGASKHNISSIFNAETFIIGFLSGIFGITISYLLIPIINLVLHHFTGDIPLNAALDPKTALFLIILSVILTLIGGLIPARSASKKDPVEALRSE
jgi:ABC-type antimicrobial peptide transport system permease subunit